ncbi:hypothetical protein BJL96_35945 [Burkholderia cenocepacia]|nr:hypothetical protein A3203_09620 [Burkholderia cenocepacia]NGO92471.1 hypothetical protein [Burkholderia cenocepacia]
MAEIRKLDGVAYVARWRKKPRLERHVVRKKNFVIARLDRDQKFLHQRIRSIVWKVPPYVLDRISTVRGWLDNRVRLDQYHVPTISTSFRKAKIHQNSDQVILTFRTCSDEKMCTLVLSREAKCGLQE